MLLREEEQEEEQEEAAAQLLVLYPAKRIVTAKRVVTVCDRFRGAREGRRLSVALRRTAGSKDQEAWTRDQRIMDRGATIHG